MSCAGKPETVVEEITAEPPLPPQPVVIIEPQQPMASDDLYCEVTEPLPGVEYHYSWAANNRIAQSEGATLRADVTQWGDIWSCIVTPSNSGGSGESGRAQIAVAEGCSQISRHSGDLFLQDQEDFGLFCRYSNAIDGDLWIQGGDDMADLSCLCEVQGNLYISNLPEMAGNQSLPNLEHIRGDITIFQNDRLNSLQLPKLSSIGDDLQLISSSLESLSLPIVQDIGGELYIEGNPDLEMIFLPELRRISSAVTIINNASLSNTPAALENVGGDINIRDNPQLLKLPFENLTQVNGSMQFLYNDSIKDLSFPSLLILTEGASITKMAALTEIDIPLITYVQEGISIQQNPSLQGISLPSLLETGEFFKIEYNESLSEVNTTALERVNGDLHLRSLPLLTNLDLNIKFVSGDFRLQELTELQEVPLEHVQTIEQSLIFDQNLSVEELSLPSITTASSIIVIGNDQLRNLTITPMAQLNGSLEITYNMSLENIHLEITTINEDILIQANSALTGITFEGLHAHYGSTSVISNPSLLAISVPELTSIDDSIIIIDNETLGEINFGALSQIQGGLWMQELQSLQDLNGFQNLETISSDLRLVDSALEEVSLVALSSIGRDLQLDNLSNLINIEALTTLNSIGGDLEVKNNETLEDISSLMNLWSLHGDYRVIDNPNLPTSQAQQILEHLLFNQYSGGVVISGNAEH